MMGFEFGAHPTMIFKIIKPYLFILILPFIRAFTQYLTIGKTSGTILFEFVIIVFISILAFLGWKSIKIRVKSNKLIINRGFFIKSHTTIDIDDISSVSTKQNVIDLLFGSVTCCINTEAGGTNKNDFEFKLYKNDAKILTFLVFGSEETKKATFSLLKTVLLAAGTSSVITGLVIGIPTINKAEDFINIAISEVFLNKISKVTSDTDKIVPELFNLITVVFIMSYVTSFLISFFKKINFRLYIGKSTINVQSGLITRKRTSFKKKSINNVCFEQTFLMRIFKKYYMRASIAGYGDNKGESATIAPIVSKKDFKKHLNAYCAFVVGKENVITPNKEQKTLNRFFFVPALVLIITIFVLIVITISLSSLLYLVWPLALVVLIFNLNYADICYHNYKYGFFGAGDIIKASGVVKFKTRELYCQKDKLGIIKISQTPADKKYKTCKLKIVVRSESSDTVNVKNVDLKAVLDEINQAYKINISV